MAQFGNKSQGLSSQSARPFIEKIEELNIYENPIPLLKSRQAKFPGVVQLPDGELLCLFELGEAFDAADSHTCISRSSDQGQTWRFQGDLYDMAELPGGLKVSETLKPTLLADGSLVAMGYRYHRGDDETPIANPETGGLLPGDNVISFSSDQGRSWSIPQAIERGIPELVETSGPCVQTQSGDLVAIGAVFKAWDGSNPSGQAGVVLRSKDKGKTWAAGGRYCEKAGVNMAPFESRLCEMQPGRLVALIWAYDMDAGTNLNNHVVVSHDNGYTWLAPLDTGIGAQASNLMWLGGERLLTIHAHRAGSAIGLYVRLVDFTNDQWKVLAEEVIWAGAQSQDPSVGLVEQFAGLRFGQPSLVKLDNGELLATHWCVEDGLHVIKTHRLKLNV